MVAKLKLRNFRTRRLHHPGAIGHGDMAIDGRLLSCHPRLARSWKFRDDSAPSTGFAEAVNDAVSLSADRGIERQLRMIVGGVAQQIGLGFELKPRTLEIRAEHRRVDAVELSDDRAC